LYKTFKPLATVLVKKQVQKAIKDSITTGMEYVDEQLVGVRDSYDQHQSYQRRELHQNVARGTNSSRFHSLKATTDYCPTVSDIYREERRIIRPLHHRQRSALVVQGCAQQTELHPRHWSSRWMGQLYH